MFGWFRKRPKSAEPGAGWVVATDAQSIRVSGGRQRPAFLARDDLSGVVIETNDKGPWGADVWWLLFGADNQLACAFPQGAIGDQAFIDHLMTLPGFDHDAMIAAMASTHKAMFPVWRKER